MGKIFKQGDKIKFLNEQGSGEVIELLDKNIVRVLRSDGFEQNYKIEDLIVVNENDSYFAYGEVYAKEESMNSSKKSSKGTLQKNWKIDLHIENLLSNYHHMKNYDIVTYQINYCENIVRKAIKNNVYKLTIIHGKGSGVLREEVLYMLKKYDVETKDSFFEKHGGGATDVFFK